MRFDNLQAWLDWQSSLHPKEIELGLGRIRQVWQRMDCAPLAATVITVAGTNGKGSVSAFLESILLCDGYKVGCYSSPHIVRYNERVRILGEAVTDEDLCRAFDKVDQARGNISLTYFEFGTLAAFALFAERNLDVVVLEAGLGGRLDAVNIIDADVSIITRIGLDHTDWLGNTEAAIALEKFGIARSGKPLVLGERQPPAELLAAASEKQVPLYQLGQDFDYEVQAQQWRWWGVEEEIAALPWPALRGQHQLDNAAVALMALQLVHERWPVSRRGLRDGLSQVNLPGRFQLLPGQPPIILDVAHNAQACEALAENLRASAVPGKTHAVFAMLSDKDIVQSLLPVIPLVDHWYLAPLHGATRAVSEEILVEALLRNDVGMQKIKCYNCVEKALNGAVRNASLQDRVVVFGSFFTVAEAVAALQEKA